MNIPVNKQTKLILSILGISAVVVPVLLLVFLSGKALKQEPEISSEKRSVDTQNLEETVKKIPKKEPVFASPQPATPSATPVLKEEVAPSPEGSPSSQ